jgi:hypothetical protein
MGLAGYDTLVKWWLERGIWVAASLPSHPLPHKSSLELKSESTARSQPLISRVTARMYVQNENSIEWR